jgi:prepilin-type processing-associated H-X9-DG protein
MNFVNALGYDRFPKLTRIKEPAETIYLGDSKSRQVFQASFTGAILTNWNYVNYRHPGNMANILYVDGSVRGTHFSEINTKEKHWIHFWENQGPAVAEPAN